METSAEIHKLHLTWDKTSEKSHFHSKAGNSATLRGLARQEDSSLCSSTIHRQLVQRQKEPGARSVSESLLQAHSKCSIAFSMFLPDESRELRYFNPLIG